MLSEDHKRQTWKALWVGKAAVWIFHHNPIFGL